MAVNKVVLNGETIVDLTSSSVTAAALLKGYTAHNKAGEPVTGTCAYDADTSDATATAAQILSGYTAYASGAKKTGSMTNRGAVSGTISTKAGTFTIPAGYHNGSGSVSISSTEQAKIIASNIKSGVSILGVAGSYSGLDTSDATATAGDILSGKTAYVNGVETTGTLTVQSYYTGTSEPASTLGSDGDLYFMTEA